MELFIETLSGYPLLAPIVFILLRTLPVIIPPIPGILVDLAGVAIFGWGWALLYSSIGVATGAMAAFGIARHFRKPVVERFISLQRLAEWQADISGARQFWGLVALRVITSPGFDYVNYVAGLTKIRASRFFLATILGIMPQMLLVFYAGGSLFEWRLLEAAIAGGILIAGLAFAARYARRRNGATKAPEDVPPQGAY